MSSENKQLVRRAFLELWNQGKLTAADSIYATNYLHHDPASPHTQNGPEGVKQTVLLCRNAFPDLIFTIDQMMDVDEFVTTRFTGRGTHKGELTGIAPTNRFVKIEGILINRMSRGRIAEGWVVWDALGLMQQLGAMPALEKPKTAYAKS
jgi:steroid delta-isomerase-like uncharacterized protein